jgi:hypothetical protein
VFDACDNPSGPSSARGVRGAARAKLRKDRSFTSFERSSLTALDCSCMLIITYEPYSMMFRSTYDDVPHARVKSAGSI